jgi:plastocyanin
MPVWADTNGGPLNYLQIEDIIAFIRAPSDQEYEVRDPELNEPVLNPDGTVKTFKGWRDPNFKPDPAATPVPDCHSGGGGGGTPAPSESLSPDATVVELVAQGVAFDKKELTVPAGEAFGIHLVNKDGPGLPHNVQIKAEDGTNISDPPEIEGGEETTYVYPALDAGTYTFICRVHPIPAMTGTLTVQ